MPQAQERPRLLFVDDRSKRTHFALEFYAGYDVWIASNVRDALRTMCAIQFDVVSLDHDLNGCDFEDPDSPTCGMEIVRYIGKTGWPHQMPKPVFVVHSKNLFAANMMVLELKRLGFEAKHQFLYDETGRAK